MQRYGTVTTANFVATTTADDYPTSVLPYFSTIFGVIVTRLERFKIEAEHETL
jgi:hypothetical protein